MLFWAEVHFPCLSWLPVTCHAGVTWAQGSGWVGLRVRTDVASVSGLLCRLVFHVQDLVAREGSSQGVMVRGVEGQEGYECRVDNISRRCYSITKLIYFCVLRGLLYNTADYRAGKEATQTTRGRTYNDALTCVCGCA